MILPYRGAPRRVKNVEHITCPGCKWTLPDGAPERGTCPYCGNTSLWYAVELQSARGKASVASRRKATAERDAEILRLHKQNVSNRKIAKAVGMSEGTVRYVLRRVRNEPRAPARAHVGGLVRNEPRARVRIRIRGMEARDAGPSRIERRSGESVPFPPLRLTGSIAARS